MWQWTIRNLDPFADDLDFHSQTWLLEMIGIPDVGELVLISDG